MTTRFFDELTQRTRLDRGMSGELRLLMEGLTSKTTRRLLFDSRQAATFWNLGEGPPVNVQSSLMMPFDDFYMEFTDPVMLHDFEDPRYSAESPNVVRSFFVRTMSPPLSSEHMSYPVNVTVFTVWPGDRTIETISYAMDLAWGIPFVPQATLDGVLGLGRDVRRGPDQIVPLTPDYLDENPSPRAWLFLNTANLLSWCLTYMMSKSIEIVEEPLYRSERRRRERRGIPNDWYLVRVDPSIVWRDGSDDGDEGGGIRHRHRYDVMGHLRFGRHRLKDGTWRTTVEWVRPHQRGLANARYVPATRRVDGGRSASPMMSEWWGHPPPSYPIQE